MFRRRVLFCVSVLTAASVGCAADIEDLDDAEQHTASSSSSGTSGASEASSSSGSHNTGSSSGGSHNTGSSSGGVDGGSSSGGVDDGSSSGGSSSGGMDDGSSSGGSSSGGSSSGGAPAEPAPWLVMCMYGYALPAFGADGANPRIEQACAALPYTLVRKSASQVGWEHNKLDDAYNKLFQTLDSNRDGRVDDNDAQRRIAILGHSWGGMNVADLGKKLQDDARVSASRKSVELAVSWDPYKWPNPRLRPSSNVKRFIVLRQSITPAGGDCSSGVPLFGPFNGVAPKCPAGQRCEDYDYSLSPNTLFPNYPSGGRYGKNIGHCTAFDVGFFAAKELLEGREPLFPQSVAVAAP